MPVSKPWKSLPLLCLSAIGLSTRFGRSRLTGCARSEATEAARTAVEREADARLKAMEELTGLLADRDRVIDALRADPPSGCVPSRPRKRHAALSSGRRTRVSKQWRTSLPFWRSAIGLWARFGMSFRD